MKFAFVFPGQGSQSVGMVSSLAESYPVVKECFQEASDTICVDLWKLVQEGPAEELNYTQNTQPAMLAASYAIHRIWMQVSGRHPEVMAGHSFGEISAFTCGQSIRFADACWLARQRGELMQSAVPAGSGAMAAVLGLQDSELDELCEIVSSEDALVEAVNYNAPGQVVVAGHSQAVKKLVDLARSRGAKRALELPVSVPAHSRLMKPAAEKFAQVLAGLAMEMASVPIIQNATLTVPSTTDNIRSALQAQLYSPVKWVSTIQLIREMDAEQVIELGPGKVLTGLQKRIDKSVPAHCVYDNPSLEAALQIIEE